MVWNVPEWLSNIIFILIGVGIGYQLYKFHQDPKAWLHEWFN